MIIKNYEIKNVYMGRLSCESDLLEEINKIINEKNIKIGSVSLIGAINGLKIGYYKQDEKQYVYLDDIYSDKPFEIVSCNGNISLKDGKPFAHIHIVASDRQGRCYGGHLMTGTKVFACEFIIHEFSGEDLVRGIDKITKLPLWVE
jgi:uncharacterized protein